MKLLSALTLSAALAMAQPGALPDIDQVLESYVKALGGAPAIQKLTSRVSQGSFDVPTFGVGGTHTTYAKAPNKLLNSTEVEGYGLIESAFDGEAGWSVSPEQGLQDLNGAALARIKRGAQFRSALNLKQMYSKLAVTGKGKAGERDAWVVEAATPEGGSEKMYFDIETGLLLRIDIIGESQDGSPTPASVYFEDYAEIDGVKVAHTVRQESPELVFVIKLTDVQHNVPIEEARFKKPAR